MKKQIAILTVTLAAALTASAGTVSLSAPTEVQGGFDVAVLATGVFDPPHDGGDSLFGYGFDVSFDSAVLAYTGETAGALFDDLSSNPGFGADVGGVASAGFLDPGDFTEPLTLATLHFATIDAGFATISIDADALASLDQGLAYLSGSDSFSASTTVDATPEPGTFVLAGLAALLLWTRGFSRVRPFEKRA